MVFLLSMLLSVYSADTYGQTIELSDNDGLLSQCLSRIGQYHDEINKELEVSGCGGRLSSHATWQDYLRANKYKLLRNVVNNILAKAGDGL